MDKEDLGTTESVITPLEVLDATAIVTRVIPRLRNIRGSKALGKVGLALTAYDAVDWIGEHTGLFDLPDVNMLLSRGAETVKGWFVSALGSPTAPVVAGSNPQYELLRSATGGDDAKAQALVTAARTRIQTRLNEPVVRLVAYFLWEVTFDTVHAPSLQEQLEHRVIERMLNDIPPSVFGAAVALNSNFVSEHMRHFRTLPVMDNPFAEALPGIADRLVNLLAAGRVIT